MRIVALIFAVLAVPALAVLVGTGREYLATTADVAAIRVEIVELRLSNDTTRTFAGPDIVLRVSGVAQTSLTFEEVNFDLRWQGERLAIVSSFPRLNIPRNGSLTVTVNSNLDPNRAEDARAQLASGGRAFVVAGNARIGLPNGAGSVWLTLQGQVRAG